LVNQLVRHAGRGQHGRASSDGGDFVSENKLHGTGDAAQLAGGISQALLTTAAGLVVAIPAIFFHRFFVRRVEEITVGMEQSAVHLVDLVHGEREATPGQTPGEKT